MKKSNYYILFALIFLCTGCELNRSPLDTLALENYFNNKTELETYTNGFYMMFPNAESIYGEVSDAIIPTSLTEEVLGTRTIPTNGGGWSWTYLSNINTFLKNSSRCQDVAAREEYDGVARFFRAYFYFEKVKRFGAVPWLDEPLGSTDDRLYEARTDRDELLKHMVEDIDYAINHLSSKNNTYRITKWTALALKSRMLLFEGTFRKYHGIGNANTYLQLAAQAAEDFIDNSTYTIYKSGATPYQSLFASDDAIATEVILARNYNIGLNVTHSVNQSFISDGTRPGLNKKIVDSYLMADGSRFTDQPSYKTKEYYAEMQGRDPRLAQTVVAPGYTRIGTTTKLSPSFTSTTTGYQLIKWVTDESQDGYKKAHNDFILFRTAEVYLNFAEAKAEQGNLTQNDLDKSVNKIRKRVGMPNLNLAASNSNPDPFLANPETGYANVKGNNAGVILEIRRERTIELIDEGFRYYDLVRWKEGKVFEKQFKGLYFPALDSVKKFRVYDLNGNGINDALDICIYDGNKQPSVISYPELANITVFLKLNEDIKLENGANGGNVIVSDINVTPRKWTEDRDYLYPIPQDQITLYGGKLTQNPNW
uniref:RagB/SusD family nutrient uptake outer membrane protein n=2 Tax=unclassified Prevotella TaxID=2638335 RepID=A0AB33JE05_9BACT